MRKYVVAVNRNLSCFYVYKRNFNRKTSNLFFTFQLYIIAVGNRKHIHCEIEKVIVSADDRGIFCVLLLSAELCMGDLE